MLSPGLRSNSTSSVYQQWDFVPEHFCSAGPQMSNDASCRGAAGLQGDAIRCRGRFLLDVVQLIPPARFRLT